MRITESQLRRVVKRILSEQSNAENSQCVIQFRKTERAYSFLDWARASAGWEGLKPLEYEPKLVPGTETNTWVYQIPVPPEYVNDEGLKEYAEKFQGVWKEL